RERRIKKQRFYLYMIMSLNCKISGSNGTSSKMMRKMKEPTARGTKMDIRRSFNKDKSLVLVQQFNVSKELLHELASSFYESDQISSFKCTKQLGDNLSTKHEITCSLKGHGGAPNVELWGQCPVHDDKAPLVHEQLARELDNSILKSRKGKIKKKEHTQSSSRSAGKWMEKLLLRRRETIANMCDERARMLQDQFNVSMNHVHALAILVSTFYHRKQPSAIDQKTFGEYTERTSFERPLTSGVAYALRVRRSEREKFEKEHGWTIKKMDTEDQDQTLAQDCDPKNLDPSPIQDEYAPVILSQETVSHIVSIDMMSGKEDRENILRARASGKGVLTSPFKLLKSNHLGVVLTFAVYNTHLDQDATPEQRINATVGYLGASYDVPSLVEKLLHQLASKQTIVVNVYDITNVSAPINMYGPEEIDTGFLHISSLDFGDPSRKHEMRCRFKQRPPPPWTAILASGGLINEVLDQAKIESGRLELEAVPFELRTILDNVVSLLSTKSQEKGIELAVYVSNQLPEVVVGDPGRFRQIITNLVENSLKFTHDRGHIFVSVHLADEVTNENYIKKFYGSKSDAVCNTLSGLPVVDRKKSWENFEKLSAKDINESEKIKILVTVEDTGVGIPIKAQSSIFTPFKQADSSTSRTYGGTGIGLSISKRLVGLMNGEIGFVSEPGTGSTFSFTAVFMKKETCSLDTVLQQYHLDTSEFRGLRALVIDQKIIRAEVTRYHLERLGISVEITSDFDSARSYQSAIDSAGFAMVLIDQEVWNKESGLAFLRGLESSTKLFLLTNSVSPAVQDEIQSANMVATVVPKPLRLSVLISCFQETISIKNTSFLARRKPSTLGTLLRDKRILVVDDNIVNRRVAEGALKKYGAIVTCVDSGKAALEKLKPPHSFHACFMDLQMPEMDGFEATRQIRRLESMANEQIESGEVSIKMYGNTRHWHTPILAMTADVIQATDEECMKCGMDGYVSKPFEEEQLYSAAACFFESVVMGIETAYGLLWTCASFSHA
ncbi:hypothetical protein M8C21_000633, partial [Ambrosia artemisiifolia]